MFALMAVILVAIVAFAIIGFAMHLLFSPWLLLVAVAIVAWIKLRPRRSHE